MIKMTHQHAYISIWWRQCHSCGSLFPSVSRWHPALAITVPRQPITIMLSPLIFYFYIFIEFIYSSHLRYSGKIVDSLFNIFLFWKPSSKALENLCSYSKIYKYLVIFQIQVKHISSIHKLLNRISHYTYHMLILCAGCIVIVMPWFAYDICRCAYPRIVINSVFVLYFPVLTKYRHRIAVLKSIL